MVYRTLGMSLQTNPKRHWIRSFLICVTVLIMCILISVNTKVQQVVLTNIRKNHTESTITLWNLPTHGQNGGRDIFLLPDKAEMEKMTDDQLMEIYWRYINTLQILCRNQIRLGYMKDGGKEVCEDEVYKPRKPCLVYSFGSAFQFDFEIDVIRKYRCEVHTFDPSVHIMGRFIPGGIHFHLIGLWSTSARNKKGWRMKTLSSIRDQLNHTNRMIDILKIDVEGAEWIALPEIFQSGVLKYVKQICMEVHVGEVKTDDQRISTWGDVSVLQQLVVLRQLYEHGFHIFMREHNLFSITQFRRTHHFITTVNEISLVNTKLIKTVSQ